MSESEKSKDLLIVIDMQNDFVDGVLGSPKAVAILPNVKKKIQEYMDSGMNIVLTQDAHREGYLETNEGAHLPVPHCIVGTHGHDVVSDLDNPDFYHVQKGTFGFDSWYDYLLTFNLIDDKSKIEIVGLCTDICVITNALILRTVFPETKIVVDASCCAGSSPANHNAALAVMKACCIDVINEEAHA